MKLRDWLLALLWISFLPGLTCDTKPPEQPPKPVQTGGTPGVDAGVGGTGGSGTGGQGALPEPPATCQFVEVLASARTARRAEARVINGKPADPKKYSGLCSLQTPGMHHYCTAELLSPTMLLSAGHCAPAVGDTVVCGCADLRSADCQVRRVTKALLHKQYVHWSLGHDWSMVAVDPKTPFVGLMPIPLSDTSIPGAKAFVAGWGRTCSTCPTSKVLLVAELTLLSRPACEAAYPGSITDTMLCASGAGKDAAPGDSGGFLGQEIGSALSQVGGVSYGVECQAADPGHDPEATCIGVYANLAGEVAGIRACVKTDGYEPG